MSRLLALLALLLPVLAGACRLERQAEVPPPDPCRTPLGVVFEDITIGAGHPAVLGNVVTVHYTARLMDGTVFDTSEERGAPGVFRLGAGEVVPGWEDGVIGMRVGGLRRIYIPSQLAYGPEGSPGVIPPNATIIVDVTLLDVSDPATKS